MTKSVSKLIACICFMSAAGLEAQVAQTPDVPEYVVYRHVFHQVVMLKKKADDAVVQGKDRSSLRQHVRKEAALTELEGNRLETIALQCEADVAAQDAKARVVINQYRAQFPYGIIPNGSSRPPLPPELKQMQQERNTIILLARDRLRNDLGEESYARFDILAKKKMSQDAVSVTVAH